MEKNLLIAFLCILCCACEKKQSSYKGELAVTSEDHDTFFPIPWPCDWIPHPHVPHEDCLDEVS